MDSVMCRYGELALKGKNRALFEDRLVDNIRQGLRAAQVRSVVRKVRGRIFVDTEDERAVASLTRTFGLISVSPCETCDSDPDAIREKIIDYSKRMITAMHPKTFRMTTKRIDKSFPKKSKEMDIYLGDAVDDSLEVDLKDPDLNIGVEIHDRTYVFHERLKCPGGLPLGITGNVAVLVKDGRSVAAAWLMMKRGCQVFPVMIRQENDKIRKEEIPDVSVLERFSSGDPVKIELIQSIEGLHSFIAQNRCKALVTGDTLDGIDPDTYKEITTLYPLIAYTEEEIAGLMDDIQDEPQG